MLLAFPAWLSAQTNEGDTFFLRGVLTDEQNRPVPFGNVVLYQYPDSTLVHGVHTNESGRFDLPAKPGTYYLKLSMISYHDRIIPDIRVADQDLSFGNLTLKADTKLLEEVVIKGEKSQM